MIEPVTPSETMRLRGDETNEQHRVLYTGLLGAIALVFVGIQLFHLARDVIEAMGVLALVTGSVLPLVLGLLIVGASYAFWQSDLTAEQLRRIDMWFLLGICGMLVVSGALIMYEFLEGAQLSHVPFLLLDFVTAGGVAGLLVGWYDAQNQRHADQLRVFQKAVEHSGHCIYLTDPEGIIEYVNPTFETQTGYAQEEALGRNPRMLKSGEMDNEFYEELWETILSGDVWQATITNRRKDGTNYYVDQTIAPVTDANGDIEHFVAINRDITRRKQHEAELTRQNERLDEFARVVSHDLRNPLTVALGRVELLRDEDDSEDLAAIDRALDRMRRLIDDVLTLAREGKTISDAESVSLQAVCGDAWANVDAPEATLSVQTEQSIPADRSRLQQLLENLFRNAVEHGGRDVSIRVDTSDGGFYVEDDGAGILEDDLDRLFQSGYTTDVGGTGLGLAIVKQIVDAHGWNVDATSGSDGGARFEITEVDDTIRASETSRALDGARSVVDRDSQSRLL